MAKKEFSKESIDTVDINDIPDDLYYIVAESTLYDQDPISAICSYYKGTSKGAVKVARQIFTAIIKSPKYKEYKEDYDIVQKGTLSDVDQDVLMLKLTKLMQWSLETERPEIYLKCINKVQEMKGVSNSQNEFGMEFRFKSTEAINLNMIKEEVKREGLNTHQKDAETNS